MELPSFDSYFTVVLKFAYFIGLQPLETHNNSRLFNFLVNLNGVISTGNALLYQYFFSTFLFTKASNALEVISHIPLSLFCMESWVRFFFMLYNRTKIINLVNEFRELYKTPWKNNEKLVKELDDTRRSFIRVQLMYLGCNIVFCSGPILFSLFKYFFSHSKNLLYIVNTWRPFDSYSYAWLVFLMDTNIARYAQYGNTVPDGIMIMLLIQLNYHFECLGHAVQDVVLDLKKDQKHLKMKKSTKNVIKSLKDAVVFHEKLNVLSQRVNKTFSWLTFAKFLSSSLIICCTGFVSIVSDDYVLISQFLMFLLVMLIQPFMLSVYGDLHSEKSERLAELTYNSEWYNCDNSDMKALKFMIMRSQKPCFISILNVAKVKRETFKEIMANAYSILTLLKNMYD